MLFVLLTHESRQNCRLVGKREASKSGEDKSDTYETEKTCPQVGKRGGRGQVGYLRN